MSKKPVTGKKKPVTGKKPRNPNPPPVSTRFKPGQSGNPKGKPPIPPEVRKAREILKALNDKVALRMVDDGTYEESIIMAVKMSAESGSIQGVKYLNDIIGNTIPEDTEKDKGKHIIVNNINVFN